VGSITGIGNALPKPVLRLIALCEQAAEGDATARRQALELEEALQVLSKFDEGPDLVLFYKYLLVLEGSPEYELNLNESDALSPSQREFARQQWEIFKNWWSRWSAAGN
jgi:4-hydroxy-tetrahydrodipicolinate synthase